MKILSMITLTLILLINSTCNNQSQVFDKDLLDKLKIGKFIYKNENKGLIVERDQNTQIEYNKDSKYKIEFKIVWVSDREYDMIFIGGTKGCLNQGDTIKVKIVSCTSQGYKYIADGGHCGGKKRGELIKIE